MYLMETSDESKRLLMKSDEASTREQLLQTGLLHGMTCMDAGGGAGFVSKIMGEIVGPTGRVVLYDQSSERLAAAKTHCSNLSNLECVEGSLEKIQYPPAQFDYVFCRFVFEYLRDQDVVFQELLRMLKPGGRLVIGDLDYNVLSHYPFSSEMESKLLEIAKILEQKKLWDPYAGRKLYQKFHRAGLKNIQVRVIPHHLIYGEVSERDLQNLVHKLDRMLQLQNEGILSLSFDMKEFRTEFLEFFKRNDRFSYTPLILVDAVKLN